MAKNGLWKPDKAAYLSSRPKCERKMFWKVKARLDLVSAKIAVFFESQAWKELRYPRLALSLDNLQVLCKECNQGKSNKDSTDFR